jgi:hypothetical protein
MIKLINVIERASPFFSFIIGLGLAAILFHREYTTVRTLGVSLIDATEKVVKADGKCYRYRVEDASCENTSKE